MVTTVDSQVFARAHNSEQTNTQTGPNESQQTIEDVVEKSLNAYGGRAKLAQFEKSSVVTGQVTAVAGNSTPSAYKLVRKSGLWRTETEVPAQTGTGEKLVSVQAYDGTGCWESNQGAAEYLPPAKSKWLIEREKRQPFLLTNWMDSAYKFRLLGPTNYKNIPVIALEIAHEGDPVSTVFLDQTNYFIVAITYQLTNPDDNQPANVAVEYSENRPALGVIWPFKQTETVNDHLVSTIQIDNCTSADEIASSYFAKPGESQVVRLANQIVVPFDYSQKEIVCKGRIEGSEELVLLFDTGSSETIVDRRVAALQFLTKGPDFKISTIGGDVSSQTTTIKRLELGGLIVNDVNARLLDLSPQSRQLGKPIAGIIGMNVIGKYMVTIDYAKPALTFADSIAAPRPTNLNSVTFTQSSAPLVNVNLAGNDPESLLMDTGAAFNHLPPSIARKHLAKDKGPAKHVTEGTGLDGRPLRLGSVTIDPVTIGSQSVHKVSFTYPVGGNATRTGGTDQDGPESAASVGILGNPFWQNFVVTIDAKFQRLLLKSNPQAQVRSEMESAISVGDTALVTRRDFRAAEFAFQRANILADSAQDQRYQAIALGRLGNLRRMMAHDLQRPEHAKASYGYFSKADEIARKADLRDVQGRILGDWSLLYSENGQPLEAKQTIDKALVLAPQDANVNVDYAVHLFRGHFYSEVQKYIDKALFLDPGNWQALWYQVKLSEMFSDVKKEKDTLSEILKYYPWSKVAQDKLKSLSEQAK